MRCGHNDRRIARFFIVFREPRRDRFRCSDEVRNIEIVLDEIAVDEEIARLRAERTAQTVKNARGRAVLPRLIFAQLLRRAADGAGDSFQIETVIVPTRTDTSTDVLVDRRSFSLSDASRRSGV